MADTSFTDLSTPIVASWLNDINVSVYRAIGAGGVAPTTPAIVRTNIGAAISGANADITSLSGLTTPLSVGQGGTAATTALGARTSLAVSGLADNNTFTGNNTFSGINTFSGTNTFNGTGNNFTNPLVVPNAVLGTQAIPKGQADTLYAPITSNAIAVRQTVASGPLTASGTANHITAGTGLAANLSTNGGANPVTVNYAAGSSLNGDVNYVNRITADVANAWSGLPANNLNFISTDYSAGGPTYTQKLAPHQEGYAYNQAAQSVLQFGGAAGSTTFLDDFGNTWTAQGGAKVQTNQVKFGTGALGGGGASNALNGTSDYIKSTSFTSLGNGGWAMRGWFYFSALPGSNVTGTAMNAGNSGSYGALAGIYNNAGNIKFVLNLSSNGTSQDIANAVVGTTTPAINTEYYLELTYDFLAGVYRLYVNGAQEISVTSSAHICPTVAMTLGANTVATSFMAGYIDKFEFLPYCQHPNGTAYTVPTAAPNVAAAGYASDFYSIPQMEMFSVTGPSTAAGANPTLAPINRVYHGEVTTNGAGVASVTPYAYNGKYDSGLFPVAINTNYTKSHNIGIGNFTTEIHIADDVNGTNERAEPWLMYSGASAVGPLPYFTTRNSVGVSTSAYVGYSATSNGVTSGYYRILCKRGW